MEQNQAGCLSEIRAFMDGHYLYSGASMLSKILGAPLALFLGYLCCLLYWVWLDKEETELRNKLTKKEAEREAREEARRKEQERICSIVKAYRTCFEYFFACLYCRSTNKALLFQHDPPEDIALALEEARMPFVVLDDASAETEVLCLDCKQKIYKWPRIKNQKKFEDRQLSFILIAKYRGKNPLRPHRDYQAWLKNQLGMDVSFVLPEVDTDRLREGDIVVGSLKIPDIAKVIACGCRYFHITWSVPPPSSCPDITQRHLEKGTPVVNEFYVKRLEDRAK